MNKKRVKVKYCLLGYGYASLVAYQKILQNNNRDDILILKNKKSTPIFTLEHQGVKFSPLPIFPVQESDVYQSNLFEGVPEAEPISKGSTELVNFNFDQNDVTEGSLASFMIENEGVNRFLCLALKQWGEGMLSKPLSQVQHKIKRHYLSNNGNTRMGYVDGKSLFKHAVDKLEPNVLVFEKLLNVDIEKREVRTADTIVIFENLVSTIPLHYFLEYCGLKHDHNTESAPAYFKFFTYSGGFPENQMIYDCDGSSDILRIFSISDTILMAQLRSDKYGKIQTSVVKSRIQELVPQMENLEFARELLAPMSYPLERVTSPVTLESLKKLKDNGITTLGRFGNWEYSDLHELDWTSIS